MVNIVGLYVAAQAGLYNGDEQGPKMNFDYSAVAVAVAIIL